MGAISSQDVAVWVVGGGLAGTELALQLAGRGISVKLFEQKPHRRSPAHTSDTLAELVCSNSFRAASLENAVGVIKEELRMLGGQLIRFADAAAVPAGGALAVDRVRFSAMVSAAIEDHPKIERVAEEVASLPEARHVPEIVVATGPLTSDALAKKIESVCGAERLYFYDAIAPILDAESVNYGKAYWKSRYDKGDADYLNCPLDEGEYRAFLDAVRSAEYVTPRAFEASKFFEGCLPLEVLAGRGDETLRFGCMKPVGLRDPRTGHRPHAVVQLRVENRARTALNMVGFQTRMNWSDQRRVFRMIPGLEEAEFLRMGSIHRNTYLDSPRLLDESFRLKTRPQLRFAGQITGVEGYVESMASGFLVALSILGQRSDRVLPRLPQTSTLGALHGHTLGEHSARDQSHVPSNVHWGMVPPLELAVRKKERKAAYGRRALEAVREWISTSRFRPLEPPLGSPPVPASSKFA